MLPKRLPLDESYAATMRSRINVESLIDGLNENAELMMSVARGQNAISEMQLEAIKVHAAIAKVALAKALPDLQSSSVQVKQVGANARTRLSDDALLELITGEKDGVECRALTVQ